MSATLSSDIDRAVRLLRERLDRLDDEIRALQSDRAAHVVWSPTLREMLEGLHDERRALARQLLTMTRVRDQLAASA